MYTYIYRKCIYVHLCMSLGILGLAGYPKYIF